MLGNCHKLQIWNNLPFQWIFKENPSGKDTALSCSQGNIELSSLQPSPEEMKQNGVFPSPRSQGRNRSPWPSRCVWVLPYISFSFFDFIVQRTGKGLWYLFYQETKREDVFLNWISKGSLPFPSLERLKLECGTICIHKLFFIKWAVGIFVARNLQLIDLNSPCP